MSTPLSNKSTIDEIRARFDDDVERFSNLETGQTSTVDATIAMELITEAAYLATNPIQHILDIGCGAGNNSLKLLELVPDAYCDLIDLSRPMLDKAVVRLQAKGYRNIQTFHNDFRQVELKEAHYDVVLAAAVLHHLREDSDWEMAFKKIFAVTAPGGSVWVTDLVSHENERIQKFMWYRYGKYLDKVGGLAYKEKVFAYVDKEDSPRPITYQLDLLRKVGFSQVELLHKNSTFAAFGAIKASS